MKILISKANIVNHDGIKMGSDILIENGKIAAIGEHLTIEAGRKINAENLWVFPGLVDAHCHLRDPGYEYKEDIISGSKSAARGGFTSVACMPNTNPVVDNSAVVSYITEKAKSEAVVNVYPIGAITKAQG